MFRITIAGLMIAAVMLLGVSIWVSAPVNAAAGFGVGPSEIAIGNALRGGEYERSITLHNMYEYALGCELSASDEMKGWVSFYRQDDLTTPINIVTIPAEQSTQIRAVFKIPQDAANGTHTSNILAETVPAPGAGQTVNLQLSVSVTIEVTGTQLLIGEVRSITTRDIEIDYPLRIKVEFKNTGNVKAKPQIDVGITKGGKAIDGISFAKTTVDVEAREVIKVEWKTTGREIRDDYVANVVVSLGGSILATKQLPFEILPTGTLTRWGQLTELSYEGQLEIDRVVKIMATFKNTGEIDTFAKFVGEVYKDGELIEIINSDQILVEVKESDVLKAYLKLNDFGSYNIRGHVVYDGKTTDVKDISFEVLEVVASGQSWVGSRGLLLAGIAGGVMVAIVGVIVYRRRNHKAKSES